MATVGWDDTNFDFDGWDGPSSCCCNDFLPNDCIEEQEGIPDDCMSQDSTWDYTAVDIHQDFYPDM